MNKPTTDKIERHYFERFTQVCEIPEGLVEYGDKPDVIVRGTRSIGVEITRLYTQDGRAQGGEQRQRQIREAVVANAAAEFARLGGPAIAIHVGFDQIAPGQTQTLARKLAAFVLSQDPKRSGQICRSLYEDALPEVTFIYVNAKAYKGAGWSQSQVRSPGLVDLDRVVGAIAEKEVKAGGYRACDAYWLLVVADGMDAAQEQEIRHDGWVPRTSTVFERGFLFDPLFGHVVPLIVS